MQLKNLIYLIFLCFAFSGNAQIGGDHIYEFLNLPSSARITALGSEMVPVRDDDLALAYANPATLNPSMHRQLSFNHNFHFAGISNGYAAYGHYIPKLSATFHAGMQYISYGDFDLTDEFGNTNGTFGASEYAFSLGAGKEVYERMSVGANLKVVSSTFESYNSYGLVGDLSALYHDTARLFNASLLFKNIGGQLTPYRDGNKENSPFEIQLAISKQLKYLPFRVGIVMTHLERWNISYDDPNSEEDVLILGGDLEGGDGSKKTSAVDNLFRHLVFSGEFLLGKRENLRIRFAYNHFRKSELSVDSYRSLSGFSVGLGMKISKFRIEFGRAFYHLAGGANHFSISTNLKDFKKKKKR